MSTLQEQCPHCFSTDIKIVGCYVYSPSGVKISENFSFLDLKDDAYITQKLILCNECNKHSPYTAISEAAKLAESALAWELSATGRKIPLVCPECKNQTAFHQERLMLLEQIHDVAVEASGLVVIKEHLSDEEREVVVLKYRCAVDGCAGTITVNEDTFKVTRLT